MISRCVVLCLVLFHPCHDISWDIICHELRHIQCSLTYVNVAKYILAPPKEDHGYRRCAMCHSVVYDNIFFHTTYQITKQFGAFSKPVLVFVFFLNKRAVSTVSINRLCVFDFWIAFDMPGVLLMIIRDILEYVKVADLAHGNSLLDKDVFHRCVPNVWNRWPRHTWHLFICTEKDCP